MSGVNRMHALRFESRTTPGVVTVLPWGQGIGIARCAALC
jgi:hypothetical protein